MRAPRGLVGRVAVVAACARADWRGRVSVVEGKITSAGQMRGRPRRGWGEGVAVPRAATPPGPVQATRGARGGCCRWGRATLRVPARAVRAPVPRGAPCRERRAGRRWLPLSATVTSVRRRFVLRLARMCRAPRCFRRGCPGVSVSILLRTALMASPSGTSDPSGSGRRLTEQFSGGPPSAEAPCSEAAQFPTRSRPYVHGSALPLWHEARAAGVLCRSL